MSVPVVVDGIGAAADRLVAQFGQARAVTVARRWADEDPRWGLVASRIEGETVRGAA